MGRWNLMDIEDIIKDWQREPIKEVVDIEDKLHNFRILFAYHSGKIENEQIDYHDTREIFENGRISNYTGDVRTLFEQQNQKDCYDLLKKAIVDKEQISIELIKKIHYELSKGTYDEKRFSKGEQPGKFKKHDYIVGYYDVGSASSEVEEDLLELLNEIKEYKGNKTLTVAAYFHASFENIHPFADGNGRVGRTLLNYYLMINNYPPLVIFEEDKKEYYKALEAFDKDEEIAQLVDFLTLQLNKTWNRKKLIQKNQGEQI
jgi:Fic family protein